MNYRHVFHAGNFADVFKHVLLRALFRALQRKDKPFLFLDTHAGRGRYDLGAAAPTARAPEWPEGIGRLWGRPNLPPDLAGYVDAVRECNRYHRVDGTTLRFYPGSPVLAQRLARPAARLALCELQPDECAALERELAGAPRVRVHAMDGYAALKALLPPLERRALVLIDPSFEEPDEFGRIVAALRAGLQRCPAAVYAIWYPLTGRALAGEFFAALRTLPLPPTLAAELRVHAPDTLARMGGCGMVVLNPPWRFDDEIRPVLAVLADLLAVEPGATGRLEWLVRETS